MTKAFCKFDNTPLLEKATKRTPAQLTKPYYYSAYYVCPTCKRIFHDNAFKVVNQNTELFSENHHSVNTEYDVEIWTDGACTNNGTPLARASWAFVSGSYEEAGSVDGKQTNNRGEGLAIYNAIKWAAEKGHKKIKIHTDSQITIHGVLKRPEMVKENRDIFQRIYDEIKKNDLIVEYVKVPGHADDINNNRADRKATSFLIV